jgi:hypothetical protein
MLRLEGSVLAYVEANDPALPDLDAEDRESADAAFTGSLLVRCDGGVCALSELRR